MAVLALLFLHLPGCEDEHVRRDYPRVRTLEVTNITGSGATFVGEVYGEGNVEITEHGFTWALRRPEVIADERILLGSFSGTGRYEADISTALEEGITYEVCAFVKAGDYTVYGDKVKFTSLGSGAPEISDFMPKSAGWGDTVTITGRRFSHLNTTNRIHIGEVMFSPFYSSDTILKFVLPPEAVITDNDLSVSIFGNIAPAVGKLTLIPPEVYNFSPVSGYWGDTITVKGKYLGNLGCYTSDGLWLNGDLRSTAVLKTRDSASFVIPGILDKLTSSVSLSYNTFNFSLHGTLTLLPPETDSISPGEGTWGTSVTLYGKYNILTDRSQVLFGDKQCRIISASRDSLVVRAPDDLNEYISVITYKSEPFNCESSVTFALKKPEIIKFSPNEGYAGQLITIRGRYFKKNMTSVKIGGKETWVQSVTDSVITCYMPGDAYGECSVAVSLMGYTALASEVFHSTNHIITEVTPLTVAYGETITIRGTNLRPGTVIFLGPYQIIPEIQTEEEIQIVLPPWLPYQQWSLIARYKIWDSDHWVESSFTFPDYLQIVDFTLTGITPLSGAAGDILTITGTNFGSPEVAFGSVRAEVIESTSSQITVRVPPLSSGEHTINVTIGGRTHACPVKYTHNGPWLRINDLPFLYDYGCAFDFGEEAYVITGGESVVYSKEIYRFDPSNKGFAKVPGNFYSSILNPISCTLEGKGYMIGQKSNDFAGVGFEVFNPDSATLRRLPDYPGTKTVNPCIIADDSVIYAGCGKMTIFYDHIWYRDFWKYSPATNKWTRLADCPYYVSFSNQVFIDGRIIFLGHLGLYYLLEYHPLTNTWSYIEMNESEFNYYFLVGFKYGARVSVENAGKWYVGFGDWYQTNLDYGVTNPGINNRFYTFNPADNSWVTINNVAAPPRTFAFSFSIEGKIYIGGHQIYRWYDFWEYDPQLDQ